MVFMYSNFYVTMRIVSMFIFFCGGSPTVPARYEGENVASKDACCPSKLTLVPKI